MSKKMCPNKKARGVKSILQYDLPTLREGKTDTYVSFNAFDPEKGRMRRKRIKLNHINGVKARREYARDLIKRLTEQLQRGWNPWICRDTSNLKTFEEAIERYTAYIDKMNADGLYRKETYVGYKSYIKILTEYSKEIRPIYYIYQFDSEYCSAFLDFIFIDRNNCAQTRNNYLNFLRIFSGYLLEKGYIKARPTDPISPISKRLFKKQREVIPTEVVGKIAEHLKAHDSHFLFACYLLYYCFIRPVEMTRLKISDISVSKCTITIPAESSKNKRKQTVTMPKKVLHLAIDLGIFNAPQSYYIFGEGLSPGADPIDSKIFRDRWAKVRKALKLKAQYKFYSLKDTGITEMCDNNMPTISVRDQARHSSLSITDIYTRHDSDGNAEIINLDGSL